MVPGGVQNPGGSAEAPIDRAECQTRLQLVHCHFGLLQEREGCCDALLYLEGGQVYCLGGGLGDRPLVNATDCVRGNLSPLEEATMVVIRMGKEEGGGFTHSTHSPWCIMYALTCFAHTSRFVHVDSNWEEVYSSAMGWLEEGGGTSGSGSPDPRALRKLSYLCLLTF